MYTRQLPWQKSAPGQQKTTLIVKKYSFEDLNVGMVVRREQLKDIYGVWIYFDNDIPGSGS